MELKPCPFCGGKAFVHHVIGGYRDLYRVHCGNEDCPTETATKWQWKKEQAIEAWNRRVDNEH